MNPNNMTFGSLCHFCLWALLILGASVEFSLGRSVHVNGNHGDSVGEAGEASTTVLSMTGNYEDDDTAMTSAPESVESSKKDNKRLDASDTTAIIIGCLFALTMIVKGVPVVVAYSLSYCTHPKLPVKDGQNALMDKKLIIAKALANSTTHVIEVATGDKPEISIKSPNHCSCHMENNKSPADSHSPNPRTLCTVF